MQDSGLLFQNVRFSFAKHCVLHELDLNARPGEFLAVVGPNGCGKSTALKLAAGLLRPDHGQILVNGIDNRKISRKALSRQIALLTQSTAVSADLTVHDLVAMGRYVHQGLIARSSAEDEHKIAIALETMQICDLAGCKVGQLSGGQVQRCRMAMVLAQDSDTLLLDEPTTYLDLRHQCGILETARAQASAGRTVVAVLHDFTHASLYADRIAVLDKGRLVAQGRPVDVLTEELVARVFGVETHAVQTHGALIHVPKSAVS